MSTAPPLYAEKTEDRQLHDSMERSRRHAEGGIKKGKKFRDGVPKAFFPERHSMTEPRPLADKAAPAAPDAGVLALTRLGFGVSESDLNAFNALGGTDAARFQAWINQQLNPASIDDSACDARVSQAGYTTLGKTTTRLWTEHLQAEDWQIVMQPFWETHGRTWLRAIHSKRQLNEIMVDFWHNHFNIFADEVPYGPLWAHWDRDVIRANALGNFRQMLEASAASPAMLFYLDNAYNSNEDANENYARELMELHTLGADHYFGSTAPNQVPTHPDGTPMGYVEDDVVEAARCLTGWTVDTQWVYWQFGETGNFRYEAPWHDTGAKSVVGLSVPAGQGDLQDARDLFDHLASHPGTAAFVAGKIARRLMADQPPQSVVDDAAATFLAHVGAADQIARVVRSILEHPLFLVTWGEKVKRPFEIAASMFRGVGVELPFDLQDMINGTSGWFLWEYRQTGHALFRWAPPNGYPDIKEKWNTTSPRVMTWRLANMLLGIWDEDTDYFLFDLRQMTPAGVRSAQEIVGYWSQRILGRALPTSEAQPLIDFMAQDSNPDADLPIDADWETAERLRGTVSLILMSPTSLWK
ncbi:MAG: DUF1800 domain-containing protein [Acidobacteriota bacterium]